MADTGGARDTQAAVRERYATAARQMAAGAGCGCCGGPAAECDPVSKDLYSPEQLAELPAAAGTGSLGCGNPTALAELRPGEVVLDLGSGGGLDVLLSARRVAPGGKAYGLDMTEEMLALARANQQRSGIANAEFLQGEMENIPLPDASVDVIVSNCVVNLSADKDRVLREAFRVLRPGGRLAISDVVCRGAAPAAIRRSMELWAGCIAGALEVTEYERKLASAGFTAVAMEFTRVYRAADAEVFLAGQGWDAETLASQVDGLFASAFIRARKP